MVRASTRFEAGGLGGLSIEKFFRNERFGGLSAPGSFEDAQWAHSIVVEAPDASKKEAGPSHERDFRTNRTSDFRTTVSCRGTHHAPRGRPSQIEIVEKTVVLQQNRTHRELPIRARDF